MARQFQPPTQIRQAPTKEEALLSPVAQTIQTLPSMWANYKRQRLLEDMELQKVRSQYGTGAPPPLGPMAETKEEQLARLGTEAFGKLNQPQYVAPGVDPVTGKPTFTPYPEGTKPGPAAPGPTPVLNAEGAPVTTTVGKPTVLPRSEEEKIAQKKEAEKPKATGSFNNTMREYDNMIKAAESIQNDSALPGATGLLLGRANVSEGQRRIDANLETLKAKTLLNVLSSLKDLSKTGASGFGQLSELEGENIRNSISSLKRSQGTKDFKASLGRFIEEMKAKKNDLRNTFVNTYGDIPEMPGNQGSSMPEPGTVEDGYKFKGGDPSDPQNWEKM